MNKKEKKYYLIALCVLLALSAYPVVMGLKLVILQWSNGGVTAEDYARYVIPYAAICLAALAAAALYPLLRRLKKWTVPVATALALVLFVGAELYMESITINPPAAQTTAFRSPSDALAALRESRQTTGVPVLPVESGAAPSTTLDWQLLSCVYTPAAVRTYLADPQASTPGTDDVLRQDYSDAFKIHYFLVAFVMIALVTGVFYGYGRRLAGAGGKGFAALNLQLVSAVLLIAFCVFANFTGFFREREDVLPPLSAALTGAFFVVLGAAAGVYAGSYLIGRRKWLSVAVPAVAAAVICAAMYFGEYMMMGGSLYRFGTSGFFQGLPGVAVAPADILVVLLAGGVTAGVMALAGRGRMKKAAPERAA